MAVAWNEIRHKEIPRYVIVSDFNRIALHNLEPEARQGLLQIAIGRLETGRVDSATQEAAQ